MLDTSTDNVIAKREAMDVRLVEWCVGHRQGERHKESSRKVEQSLRGSG